MWNQNSVFIRKEKGKKEEDEGKKEKWIWILSVNSWKEFKFTVDLPEGIQSFNKHIKLATSVDQIQQKEISLL